uniref:Uncharacterized protein n=1 Tax=Trichogramma kaykai TaxID=54128 RepID=A0ABD2XKB8_9HYME
MLNPTYFCPEFQRVTFLFEASARIEKGAALNPAQLCMGHLRNSNWTDKRINKSLYTCIIKRFNIHSKICHPSCHTRISVFNNKPLIHWSPKMHLPVRKVEVAILWLCGTKQICSQSKKIKLSSTLFNHF